MTQRWKRNCYKENKTTDYLISKPNKIHITIASYNFLRHRNNEQTMNMQNIQYTYIYQVVQWPHNLVNRKKTQYFSMHMKNTLHPIDVFPSTNRLDHKKSNMFIKKTVAIHTHTFRWIIIGREMELLAKTKGHNWHFFSPFDRHVKLSPLAFVEEHSRRRARYKRLINF